MKHTVAILTALALSTGAAAAAGPNTVNERPGDVAHVVSANNTTQVRADSVLTTKELHRAGLSADAKLTVTSYPSEEYTIAEQER
ncbi:hypothetical protein [Paracoccus homiensis]|uniref:DUF4148 domain-containing protein n=1 Tax=Paracoccus homiensis TaxID=364199 RepID=A0A1I0DRA9_9RHOB|nr:hypothetical protein [Paracoccus homiensis]SET35125.1 hypothetical protein SAMN04489858_104272 [Paracoccus homiensis]